MSPARHFLQARYLEIVVLAMCAATLTAMAVLFEASDARQFCNSAQWRGSSGFAVDHGYSSAVFRAITSNGNQLEPAFLLTQRLVVTTGGATIHLQCKRNHCSRPRSRLIFARKIRL